MMSETEKHLILQRYHVCMTRCNKLLFNMCQKPYTYEKMKRIYDMQGTLKSLSFLASNVLMDDFAYCKHISRPY